MAPPDLTARPLGMAEVIDRSVALTRRHFPALFVTMLVVQAPALLLVRQIPSLAELVTAIGDPEHAAALAGTALRGLAGSFLALLMLQLAATAAAAAIVAPTLDPRRDAGRPPLFRALGAVASSSALQVLLLTAAPFVGMLPGLALVLRSASFATALAGAVAATAGAVGLFLVVLLRLVLAPAAAALEGLNGLGALLRSARLMSPRRGKRLAERPGVRASLILFASFVLALAVNGLAGLPRLLALRLASGPGAGLALLGAQLPLPLEIALALFEAAASAALQPFSLVAVVVFYYDRRARTEGLDLEIWAGRLEAGP
ncbi:MAG TPA: hypothetical protein VFG59_11950 [Anaeromyxobacter sp.]|nr:hypothetical protein [Anaeromyxobacter sp.]